MPTVVVLVNVVVTTPLVSVMPVAAMLPKVVVKVTTSPATGLSKASLTVALMTLVLLPLATNVSGAALTLTSAGGPATN